MTEAAVAAPTPLADHFSDAGASSLRGWLRVFAGRTQPRVIGAVLLVSVVLRLLLGGWRWADLGVAVGYVLWQPFTEWNLHVGLLHFRPRTIAGRYVDPFISRKHRAHHLDPEHIGLVLVALPALVGLIVLFAGLNFAGFRDPRLALTATTTGFTLLMLYEWSHFLIHSPHVPRTRLYRAIWRSHRLHHFKNEKYWFGITSTVADHVLRTHPDRRAVETSPTARTLGVEPSAG